jgi:hypothetical protein
MSQSCYDVLLLSGSEDMTSRLRLLVFYIPARLREANSFCMVDRLAAAAPRSLLLVIGSQAGQDAGKRQVLVTVAQDFETFCSQTPCPPLLSDT